MITRHLAPVLRKRLSVSSAVAVLGPRQCGKTTLARSLGGDYFDLEQDADRLRLDLQWDDLIRGERLAILDEAQEYPEIFRRLRGAIDADRDRAGRFLLLGSVSPRLMTRVWESLAGRLSLLHLTPLLRSEIPRSEGAPHWLIGGYPDGGILDRSAFPRWERDYLTLLAQRDLPAWGLAAAPQTTDRLFRMLAALHGQLWNASEVGRGLGLSHHTVNGYLNYMVGSYLIRRLEPWQANLGKRLVKTPKIFWRDSGLLHALHGVGDLEDLLGRPWVGASWEGYVIEQILGELSARGLDVQPWFFRTSDGREIDLLLERGSERMAIEIKLTSSPSQRDLERLEGLATLVGAASHYLVSQTRSPVGDERRGSVDLEWIVARAVAWGERVA